MRRLGPLQGRRVLVTGASGGVGRYAVQLAALEGAHVIASVGSPSRAEGLRELGAAEIVLGPAEPDRQGVRRAGQRGRTATGRGVYYRLEDDGVIQAIGKASKEPTTIDFEESRSRSQRGRIENFNVTTHPSATTIARLVGLLSRGRAGRPRWAGRGPWEQALSAAEALLSRRVQGRPSSPSLDGDDDLAERLARGVVAVGGGCVVEGEDPVDDRAQPTGRRHRLEGALQQAGVWTTRVWPGRRPSPSPVRAFQAVTAAQGSVAASA
ncbi:hypothetical protein GCM10020219_078420 [Nonomuraea dietziae]